AVVTVDALHVTYLFWTDDTREHALRWRRHSVAPGTRIVGLSEFARGDLRERGSVLVTDTQSDDRLHVWYSAQRSQPEIQTLARLAREGKLLRRFEWLPRRGPSPPPRYYDLTAAGVALAVPPPHPASSGGDRG